MILYFDTETTGLSPGRIIQLSYIMDYGDRVEGKNFYFFTEYIEPSASMIHGITVEKLYTLSNGKTFSDFADEIYDDFLSADLVVSHNFSFDLNFMIAEFRYLDRIFRYNESLDTMRFFTPILKIEKATGRSYKYPKLSELMSYYDVFSYDVSRATMSIFNVHSLDAHDSRFDTVGMYLSVKEASCQNSLVKELIEKYI